MFKHLRSSPITYSQYFIAKQHLAQELIQQIPNWILRTSHVIEIGPGKGRLTEFLAHKAHKLTAIEVDYNFWRRLREQYKDLKNVSVLCGDFLDFVLPNEPYSIVSNLPFFLARMMLLKTLKAQRRPEALYVILQQELREELEGLRRQYAFDIRVLRTMKRADFEPMPRVESEYVEILPHHKKSV